MTDFTELGASAPRFSITAEELVEYVEHRDRHDSQWLEQNGGIEKLSQALCTDLTNGISGDEIKNGTQARIQVFGENRFRYPPPKSFFRLVLEAFKDITIIILCIAAVISLIIGIALEDHRKKYGYLEGIAIILVVIVVVLVQAIIDKNKEAKFRQLNSVKDQYDIQVVRAGTTHGTTADNVLVGDIIKIAAGDKVPADGILVQGSGVKTNESAMTGEPIDIEKEVKGDIFLLSGTTVSEGVGLMLVIAVGENSQWGIILKSLIVQPESTPLQDRLDKLAMTIGKIGTVMAALTFLVSLIRWIADNAQRGRWDNAEDILDFFIDAVTIVVVAIPEGLPLAITLGLAFAMRKMMKDNNMVRRLEACETMGSATTLNADKTGTLTQNRMTIVEADWGGQFVSYPDATTQSNEEEFVTQTFRNFASVNMAINSQANLEFLNDGRVNHLGNKTECALLQQVQRWGNDYRTLRKDHEIFRVYMFDSTKKSMSTAEKISDGKVRLYTKGAPEMVIRCCSYRLSYDGETIEPIDSEDKNAIMGQVEAMARKGLRTLLMAYRDVEHDLNDKEFWKQPKDENLIYLGIVGIKDPIRPETKEAVRCLKEAGVTVRMVTGDNVLTATYIAREAGILEGDGLVMEGPEFRSLSAADMRQVALKIRVLARSTPNDKLLLVREHKRLGEVTSVTGDGTNDGPALKEADVGFALGIAGTEIAKEACDIVILDDNIQSMTKAVLWGRNVYESIRKFLQFQLVVNIVAVTLNFISACAKVPLPLGAVPLLWVNMIMDSMGALALATEPPRDTLLQRKPYGRRAPLINRAMFRNIIGVAVYQLIVCLVLQFRGREIFGLEDCTGTCGEEVATKVSSIIFNVFVFMQIGSEINSRRISARNVFADIQKSFLFMIIIAITILIQVALMFGVGGTTVGLAIGIDKINGAAWGASIVLGLLVLPWGFFVRFIPLDWCYGPLDEDPTEMSKLEKLLHLPKRKVQISSDDNNSLVDFIATSSKQSSGTVDTETTNGAGFDDFMVVAKPPKRAPSPAQFRLRIFVHAVAFVNAVSKGKMTTKSDQ